MVLLHQRPGQPIGHSSTDVFQYAGFWEYNKAAGPNRQPDLH